MKFLLTGLGNIGAEYEKTRHNIGFEILDEFVKKNKGEFGSERLASYSKISFRGKQVHCIKPTTYMNLSGKSVMYWQQKLKIPNQNLLIITDDLALPLGKLRLRAKGSDAGHNGLKSIIESLNSQEFPRLRFGIGDDFKTGSQINFVLGKWQEEEISKVESAINDSINAIELFILEGADRAMNKINQKK